MKKTIFLTGMLAAGLILNAQAPEIEWQNTIGGNSHDVLNSVIQTTDGGYLLGGGIPVPI